MDISDEMDKSWDHPWSTEEMRKKRREWSLAGDAGLLKHLQEFSENLVSRANKTQEALDSLTTQLSETAILIDNVTNTSLALANTQFIESRVQEDDIEIQKGEDSSVEESKTQDLVTADLLASVSESVRQGLNIIDEKYKRMEVVDSDSEDEDDAIVLSVILGPNNPYQDRPLPYVIGSDKWNNSNKIGLESSSSESEQIDNEDESESERDDVVAHRVFDIDNIPKINVPRFSSPSNEAESFNQKNDVSYMNNGKIDEISQNNMNSASESITPTENVPKVPVPSEPTPNFAEELAKRLGTVRQAQKPVTVEEGNEASINRFKEDLFTPEEDDSMYNNKSESIFSGSKGFFNDQSSVNLWKEKSVRPTKTNIIPASIDVPPPISTVSTKPKSAIDDIFADADSEDSDDIFSSKNIVKKISKDNNLSSNNHASNAESVQKKYLDIAAPAVSSNMATSTPETNVNASSLFSDEDDDGDLFGAPQNHSYKSADVTTPSRKKPVGGVSILGNILASDIENKVSSRIPRDQSPGLSGSDTPANFETRSGENPPDSSINTISNDNIQDRSTIVVARSNTENVASIIESSSSSGISIHPPSINNTGGSSIGVDFQPQMTSTRLKSEEIYRERIASDSLFGANTRNPISGTSNLYSTNSQPREDQSEDISVRQDDVFENEDLFGPPPLPKADSKPIKSKVSSLFDDSDSGDELFSTTSSGSRSQKSTDFLAVTPQYPDKMKPAYRTGLFDEEINIFGNKDSPDVDIFGITAKTVATKQENNSSAQKVSDVSAHGPFTNINRDSSSSSSSSSTKNISNKAQTTKPTSKKISLFDDDNDIDDGDLFGAKLVKNEHKAEPIFLEEDDSDLFSSKHVMSKKEENNNKRLYEEKQSKLSEPRMDEALENKSTRTTEGKDTDILSGNGLFSTADNSRKFIFEDDDYDDLFGERSTNKPDKKENKKLTLDIKEDVESKKSLIKENKVPDEHFVATSISGTTIPVACTTLKDVSPEEDKVGKGEISKVTAIEISNTVQHVDDESKKSPPKTLDIPAAGMPSPPDENSQAPRRSVSGKIKNLMGKMGDLKILSPMDTPPLWRRSEDKTDEEDSTADRDSDDGGFMSTQGHSSPPTLSEDNTSNKLSQSAASLGGGNAETAISFDEPAQVETLSTAASKTRVRIQAKRRPQSRHARKSALKQSGIDFDVVDSSEGNSQEESRASEHSAAFVKDSTNSTTTNSLHVTTSNADRLSLSINDSHRVADSNISLATDDKSEVGSLSKESSMSANRNTLLSPSTDEEDIFDVPPDLPEDPQKEDTLFGRAPILSPVDQILPEKVSGSLKPLRDTHIQKTDDVVVNDKANMTTQNDTTVEDTLVEQSTNRTDSIAQSVDQKMLKAHSKANEKDNSAKEEKEEVIDPLRDNSHDPLKDPSQLFAFVTKTPSPEKGKNLLFSEDDSLFSSSSKKLQEERAPQKQLLDLFSDDAEGDLFSASLTKSVKKPLKDTKVSLFDNDTQNDEDDSLFSTTTKKVSQKSETGKPSSKQTLRKKISLFDDDDNDINLFSEQRESSQKSDSNTTLEQIPKNELFSSTTESLKASSAKDIFGDQSSGEDDIFTTKSVPKKVIASKSLFPSDDEDDDGNIFGKSTTTFETKLAPSESRPIIKKPVMKDLKKTAEKIGEDPLSILQDD